jgi:predicted CoA-substrate-specific enzyme activase
VIRALGIDAGSTTAKIVAVDETGRTEWELLEPTEPLIEKQVARMLASAGEQTGAPIDELPVVASGYGRNLVPLQQRMRKVTEITCHATGVFRELGHGGTLVDIGGQDSKVIVIDDGGRVVNFVMNDKCAAGTGRFLEVAAHRLRFSLEEMSDTALGTMEEIDISSTCTVFAESEIISLIARATPVEQIVRGLYRSLIRRVAGLTRSVGPCSPLMLSGGVARSDAVRRFLEDEMGMPVELPQRPQLMGAYGAALLALGESERIRGSGTS